MLQLELDPRLIATNRSEAEIEFYRDRILRVFYAGRPRKGQRKRFYQVTVEEGLSMFENDSYLYFDQYGLRDSSSLVAKALNEALPVLEGKIGNYKSLGDYRWRGFDNTLYNLAVAKNHTLWESLPSNNVNFPEKEIKEKRTSDFQPSLVSFGKIAEVLANKHLNDEQLLADLDNPRRVIYNSDPNLAREREQIFSSWNPQYFSRLSEEAKEAVRLWIYNPDLKSREIVQILVDEGYQKVTDTAVRMWISRGKRSSGKVPISQLV